MMLKMKSFGLLAGCALATGSLYAASVTNTFETGSNDWTGGTAAASNYTFMAAATSGYPTGASLSSENYVLTVEGEASYASGSAVTGSPLLDMMVQAARPDDELELPAEDTPTVNIAVAVDSEGYFNAYCKTNATLAGWCRIAAAPTDEDAWVRVSLLFDYAAGFCQIRINGEPVMSNFGYLTAADTTPGGAWYKLANATGVGLVKVAGCTAIDEFVLNDTSASYSLPDTADASGVKRSWYDDNGISWNPAASYDGSKKADGTTNMTVADKYKYCFSPFDGLGEADFDLKSMTTTAETVTIGIPKTVSSANRKVVLDYGTSAAFATGTFNSKDVPSNTETVEVPAPTSEQKVLYFRLRATDVSSGN